MLKTVLRILVIIHLSSFLLSCSPPPPIPLSADSSLYVFRLDPPALLEFDSGFALVHELPLNLPCPLTAVHPAPRGHYLALELECNRGPLVQIVDTKTDQAITPITDVDSHYLAWNFDDDLILRLDAFGNTRLVRVTPAGRADPLDLPPLIYDMDSAPNGVSLTYSFTRGIGLGSELWAATSSGGRARQLYADKDAIITFARWSPDGKQIAFIAMPDSATPFPMGELWVMDADGANARPLAPADSGHGYAAAWSPDSTRLAYVGRENPDDAQADQAASALVSNIYIVEIAGGEISRLTAFEGTLVEAPVWSADGHILAFSVVTLNDTISVWFADLITGQVKRLETAGPACCPAWIRK